MRGWSENLGYVSNAKSLDFRHDKANAGRPLSTLCSSSFAQSRISHCQHKTSIRFIRNRCNGSSLETVGRQDRRVITSLQAELEHVRDTRKVRAIAGAALWMP